MKKYTILANSVHTIFGLSLYKGEIVSEDKFGEHLKDLIGQKAIEEVKEIVEPKPKKKDDATV